MSKWLKWSILWVGLSLCIYALLRAPQQLSAMLHNLQPLHWFSLGLVLLLIWGLSVASWRSYLTAYTGQLPSWRTAIRQLGLLLVGKYLPGGIFGFLARVYDEAPHSRQAVFWAGLIEQAAGLAMPSVIGATLYWAATRQQWAWLLLLLPLPLLAVHFTVALHRLSSYLPILRRYAMPQAPAPGLLLKAISTQFLLLITWAALVAVLAQQLFTLSAYAALGIASAFLLAVAAGIIIIIAPGGIGAREAALYAIASQWLPPADALLLAAFLRLITSGIDMFAGFLAIFPKIKKLE